jgi:hypothetical protein
MKSEIINSLQVVSLEKICFSKCYLDLTGDLVAGMLLGKIIEYQQENQSEIKISKEGEYWIAVDHAYWWNECRLSCFELNKKLDMLSQMGFISIGVWDNKKNHIVLNWEVIINGLKELEKDLKNHIPSDEYDDMPHYSKSTEEDLEDLLDGSKMTPKEKERHIESVLRKSKAEVAPPRGGLKNPCDLKVPLKVSIEVEKAEERINRRAKKSNEALKNESLEPR